MLSLSANGGTVALAARVVPGQTILLVNEATRQEQECRVVYVGPWEDGKAKVGIAFMQPAPDFWQVSFPPVDRKSSPK